MSKKFSVIMRVEIERAVLVDAENASSAEEISMRMLAKEYGSDALFFPQDTLEVPLDVRTETYVCQLCGESSAKSEWGPGRVRCPYCKKIELSVAEKSQPSLVI